MSHTLILEVSEEVYAALLHRASLAGTSPALIAATTLERQFGAGDTPSNTVRPHAAADDYQTARARFERHFGAVDLGSPTGTDNDDIDADLAREYADSHESV